MMKLLIIALLVAIVSASIENVHDIYDIEGAEGIEDILKITYYDTPTGFTYSTAPLNGPVLDLGGGSTDIDAAFQQTIDAVRGCTSCSAKIDIVILRATGSNGYNSYLYNMNGVNSVRSIVLSKPNDANDTGVETSIKNSGFIFFAGGDQCNYVAWKWSKIVSAVKYAYNRGAAVGGTSAGMAILGEFINDGCGSSQGVTSSTALANPYDSSLTFTYDIFHWNWMNLTLTDQHFVARDRMGRLLVFLARQIKDGKTSTAWGVAANEETSIVVNQAGLATVVRNDGVTQYGAGNPIPPASLNPVAYFISLDHMPTTCVSGTPLTCTGYKVWKRTYGQTFNLASRPTIADYTLNVNAGAISVTGNGGSIY